MSEQNNTVETKVETVDIDIDEVFGAGADNVTLPEEESKPNIFSNPEKEVDMSFTEQPVEREDWMDEDDVDTEGMTEKKLSDEAVQKVGDDILTDLVDEEEEEEYEEEAKVETRGRKKIEGISDVFNSLIKKDMIFSFEDDKSFDDYTPKDWEELIEANLEERANQVRRETPKQFFEALPNELKVAAQYVANRWY